MQRARLLGSTIVATLAFGLAGITFLPTSTSPDSPTFVTANLAFVALEAEKADLAQTLAQGIEEVHDEQRLAQAERVALAQEQQRQASRHRQRRRPPRPPTEASVAPVTNGDVYDALANCESGMDQHRHSTGRVTYHSYFQWLISTFNSVSGLPGDPHNYDYATQKAAAQKIPLSAWKTQFPGCRVKLRAAGWAIP